MSLPCATCHADCCGPVPLSASRLARIEEFIAKMSREERETLGKQKRGPLTCHFVDMRNYQCAVYPVRPAQCDLYGRTEGMECPHHPQLVNIVTPDTARMRIDLEIGDEDLLLSIEYEWKS